MSAPAATSTRVIAQARFDAGTLLRNGEQLMVSLILPAMALVGATLVPFPELDGRRIDAVAPGILALAVLSTAFTGQAISTAFDRRYGVLRLLGATPLGRGGLLAGRILAVLVVEVIQFVVLAAIALGMGWRPDALGILPFFVFWIVGTACFVSFAMLFAGTLRAEAVLALANLVWVIMLGLGTVLPSSTFGEPWSTIVSFTPSGALGEGFRAAFETGAFDWQALGVLAVWTALFAGLARKVFRWSD
ncbi:ABC transporter permease [Blastococcus sp. Marseille-P5729]|uniref:ABC transporter permease n=1 Tax=Blastococcus sp. Marseille-P5729 TaxID=2086582 RepID=UPI000D1116F6|nr:ABC transporter permease [Blastococcus sp. Marseille-P5729]